MHREVGPAIAAGLPAVGDQGIPRPAVMRAGITDVIGVAIAPLRNDQGCRGRFWQKVP
jgi:hypothetical protein